MTLILPWFPIVLAVGVGARLLDRARGVGLGILGAVFWVVLVQAVTGPTVFVQAWAAAALLAGAVAIVAVGAWSGSMAQHQSAQPVIRRNSDIVKRSASATDYHPLCAALSRFDDWLEAHRYSPDPWPEFGELVRTVLHDLCGATHVYPYRVLSEDESLLPLRAYGPGDTPDFVSARRGIVGHVATSGKSYVAEDRTHGKLVDRLAEGSGEEIAWCFAIRQGPRRIGLVKVGELAAGVMADRNLLSATEGLICLFWTTLSEVCRSQVAQTRDPASGLLTREPFLIEADRALAGAYAQNEPVALAVFALEGTRELCDRGDWELADKLIGDAAAFLEERIRADDCLGRFDDSRFVLLLRRVDSALGRLIAEQLLARLTKLCGDRERWGGQLAVRCGLAGSGTDKIILSQLIARAVIRCNEARAIGVQLSSDLEPEAELVEATAGREQTEP